ncbi:MAG: putative toxin-antitoxin system toxin component, PIN family [Bryobacteraceae bacterium]|nr:putative toxin-antitoxin system toxin component, PIN family [Bryobacteraceae bacterium]
MRVVLDVAILVRAHNRANGPARALLLALVENNCTLVVSASLLEELERVLHYPRLRKATGLTDSEIAVFLGYLRKIAQMVDSGDLPDIPIRDPKDVHVVRAALCGRADYLCTRDRDFDTEEIVDFCARHGTRIVSDVDLLQIVRSAWR